MEAATAAVVAAGAVTDVSSMILLIGAVVLVAVVVAAYYLWQYVEGDLEGPPAKEERLPDGQLNPDLRAKLDAVRRWRAGRR